MHNERITYLLKQYLDDRLTEMERRELMEALSAGDSSVEMQRSLEDIIVGSPALADYRESEWEPLFQKILKADAGGGIDAAGSGTMGRIDAAGSGTMGGKNAASSGTMAGASAVRKDRVAGSVVLFIRGGKRWMTAAAVLVLVVGFSWVLLNRGKGGWSPVGAAVRQPAVADDVAPGGNRATLTLADGSMINLDGTKNGLLVQQGSSRLIKEKDGQLAYLGDAGGNTPAKEGVSKAVAYNLLTTPKGGQYELILPDGSKVWLNAASSLRYPVRFAGKERVVELKGEAYFEIAKNAHMPFRLSVSRGAGDQSRGGEDGAPLQVEVLGTNFNVKAYADEPFINTTLLQGSVKVHAAGQAVLVNPGERANLGGDGRLRAEAADIEEAVAWKNGLFRFNQATIEDIMRQLSRWYDVEVVYVNGPPADLFRGEIYRNVNVSKVLKVLEASGIHFTVEGKKILVQK
jgi:ferric-dicitrate binding protein FerR (iron transport regulator)